MLRTFVVTVFVSAAYLCSGQNYVCPDKSPDSEVGTVTLVEPSGCEGNPSSCSYYVSMGSNAHNSSYIDIYLEGNQEGWVAVGFSTDKDMGNDDVLGCKYDSSSLSVSVVDSWNPEPQYTPNAIDPNQDGVCTYSTAYEDGRITCYFSRYYGIVNPGYDMDLNQSYYLFLGRSTNGGSNSTNFHKHVPDTPLVSDSVQNVYSQSSNSSNGTSSANSGMELIQSHGALMVLAFMLSVCSAVFVAAWTKPLFPKGRWFKAHVILMVMGLVLGCAGLVTVIVANRNNSPPGLIDVNQCATKTAHLVMGILMIVLLAINPIIAFFRCGVDSPKRWVFFLIHGGVIGGLLQILALVNIGIGLFLFQSGCGTAAPTGSNSLLWLYMAWAVFFVAIQSLLFGTFTVKAHGATEEARAQTAPTAVKYLFYRKKSTVAHEEEMEYLSMDDEPKAIPAVLKAPNAVIRLVGLSVFLTFTVSVVVALIGMISAGVNYGDN